MPKRPQLETNVEHLDAFIGISSHLRDYRLAFLINQVPGINLEKADDLPVYNSKSDKPFLYSCYISQNSDKQLTYFLLSNSGGEGLLVPSQKDAGYFLLIHGLVSSAEVVAIVTQLKNIPNVLTAFSINQQNIPNIELLLSDLELHEISLKRKMKAKTNDFGSI